MGIYPEIGDGLKRRVHIKIVESLTLIKMGLEDSNEFVMVTVCVARRAGSRMRCVSRLEGRA